MINKRLKRVLIISSKVFAIVIIFFLIYTLYFNKGRYFTKNTWKSIESPLFYHYFSKDGDKYIVEIHDKSGDLASIVEDRLLKGNKIIFEGTNDSINIYKYDDGMIYVFNIDRNGEMTEFTPLERTKNGK
jgi:hypothetical protein